MTDTLRSLADLGVEVSAQDGYAMEGICFLNETDRVTAKFTIGEGAGVRRPRFRQILLAAASEAGSRVLWNTRLRLTSPNTAEVDGRTIKFDWLIGADGVASSVRKGARMDAAKEEHMRYAVRRHYRARPWSRFVEVHWGRLGQVCVAPVDEDCISLIFMSRFRDALRGDPFAAFESLMSRLEGAEIMTSQCGAPLVTRRLRHVALGNTALVGDASGSVDAITGEGLGMAFRQARALAECIHSGSLAGYPREHRAIGRLPHAMGQVLLMFDRHPGLVSTMMPALAGCPRAFNGLLGVHMGTASAARVLAREGPPLAWKLLTTALRQPPSGGEMPDLLTPPTIKEVAAD